MAIISEGANRERWVIDRRSRIGEPEEKYLAMIHMAGINIGVIALAGASALSFLLALLKLAGALIFMFIPSFGLRIESALQSFGVERKPVTLRLVDIVDSSLLGVILLVLAFGLKSVFQEKRYKIAAFDIKDVTELKEYLIGLVITLMGTRFLERIMRGEEQDDLLSVGIGVASVILALGIYDFVLKWTKPVPGKRFDSKGPADK